MAEKRSRIIWFCIARWFCWLFCRVCFRVSISGRENIPKTGPFLLVSNHQSFLDPLFCGVFLKRRLYFLARDTLFKHRFSGPLFTSVNAIPVKRGSGDVTAMKNIIAKLKDGCGVCLFPEGTRTIDGKISDLKPGFGLLSRRGNSVVVPVVIDGGFECWPKSQKLFSVGKRITICYGKAISAEQVAKMKDKDLAASMTDTLREMQTNCRNKLGKKPYIY